MAELKAVASAIFTFARIQELLRCLAQQVRSRKQLAKLRLVNSSFAAAATPFLFREVTVRCGQISSVHSIARSRHLVHVRQLSVEGGLYIESSKELNDLVREMLPKMPQLKSFRWIDVALAKSTLEAVQRSCPELKSLQVQFPPWMEESGLHMGTSSSFGEPNQNQVEARRLYRGLDVTIFQGLDELVLKNLYDDLLEWRSQVARILAASPGLRKLSLSLANEALTRCYRNGLWESYYNWFDGICDQFEAMGAAPLHLHSLKWGMGVLPPNEKTTLQKLTEIGYLKEIHVDNMDILDDVAKPVMLFYEGGEYSGLFDFFELADCPGLRRLTVSDYRGDVHNLFCNMEDPSTTRNLAVSCQEQGFGFELAALLRQDQDPEHHSLPLHLRMMDIELQRDRIELDDDEKEFSAGQILADVVANGSALEGLAVHLPENWSSECGFDHLDLLENSLRSLHHLTQIVINNDHNRMDRNKLSNEQLQRTAAKLAAASQKLRYVNVYWRYWRIWHEIGGGIQLEELEDREIEDVELFAHTIYSY